MGRMPKREDADCNFYPCKYALHEAGQKGGDHPPPVDKFGRALPS